MKVFKSFCMICLGVLALCNAHAADFDDIARVASRINSTGTITSALRPAPTDNGAQKNLTSSRNEKLNAPVRTTAMVPVTRETTTKSVTNRATKERTPTVTSRIGTTTISPRTMANTTRTTARAQTTRRIGTNARTTARAATINESGALVTNYKRCREIYYECMDEFCATKDANLRRCACSSRYNEFDGIKKQMTRVEDKMLDFNQRLLMVNMDADDAAVIHTSTEGEDAFYATRDNSKSKRALDEIAKKLNAKFGESDSGTSLSSLSWSLNIDSAFDTIDSIGGTDTTAKSGPALYAAAIPICREIATEVCDNDELSLAIGGYQMLIEQDCNTLYKSYVSQADAARAKVFESGALLDMSRLDTYQNKNSDDILTCKRKMLDMLTNSTVCGTDLQQCLDMTGKYIDPTTGNAFLSLNLADLDNLITRPGQNQTWTSVNSGNAFVTYLNNKKKFLEPAMEHCVDIADSVWDAFMEDALAQIKLAQTSKLEEIRRACTTLTAECLTSTSDSINEFDTRALSVFGVAANRTANAMCGDIKNSCAALIDSDGVSSWESGVSEIAITQTFDTILSSCTQVGQNCIIQACKSISGNFELCDDMDFSANRHAILERTACWPDVMECVAVAGDDTIMHIVNNFSRKQTNGYYYTFYNDLYNTIKPIHDLCYSVCKRNQLTPECAKCRITERIWGNCEAEPNQAIKGDTPDSDSNDSDTDHNHIRMPKSDVSTLLSWFAINTGTANAITNTSLSRSCINTRCTTNNYAINMDGNQICLSEDAAQYKTTDNRYCPVSDGTIIKPTSNITNCCFGSSDVLIDNKACCETRNYNTFKKICLPADETKFKVTANNNTSNHIVCIGDDNITSTGIVGNYPGGKTFKCNGRFIFIHDDTKYYALSSGSQLVQPGTKYEPKIYYYDADHTEQNASNANAWFIGYAD